MKPYLRLIGLTLAGVAFVFLLAGAVYWLRDLLEANGYPVSNKVFLVTLFAVLGAGFGITSKLILRAATGSKNTSSAGAE